MSSTKTTAAIAELVAGRVRGSEARLIRGLAKIEDARPDELTFLSNQKYFRFLETTRAGAILVPPGTEQRGDHSLIEVSDPYAAFLKLLSVFHPHRLWVEAGIHASAVIHETAKIGSDVRVGAFSYIGARSVIGDGCVIYPHAVIAADVTIGSETVIHSRVSLREGVVLGNRVVIQDGAVIGSDGFGFAPGVDGYQKIPQVGRVVIADDVEIGANTTIDRATLGETMIGAGTKLDNLIQIAHNAQVGSHTVIAAQTGISGSTKIGDYCRIGGQVGIVGHLTIGNQVAVGAQSGIAGDVADGEVVSGSPARSHSLWKRVEATLTRLPDMYRRLRKLESAVFDQKGSGKEHS